MAQLSLIAVSTALLLAGAPSLSAQQRSGAVPGDSSLFAAREAVWRDYFAAAPALAATLPDNFIAIEAGDSTWAGKAQTLANAKSSVAGGTKLTTLRFPRNTVQRYGNVAIVHSRYEAVLERDRQRNTMKGQITEVFVWDGTRWLHPSWHMDFDRS